MKVVIDIPEILLDRIKSANCVPDMHGSDIINTVVCVRDGTPYEERSHGEWIKGGPWSTGVGMGEQYGYYYTCSKCGHKVKGGYKSCDIKFCQECGADMRGEEK